MNASTRNDGADVLESWTGMQVRQALPQERHMWCVCKPANCGGPPYVVHSGDISFFDSLFYLPLL